jgi:cell wall-associated NlpC family hydrolase
MLSGWRKWGGITLSAVAALSVLADSTAGHADPIGDQQQQIQQIASQLVALNHRIEALSEEYGAAEEQKVALDAEIAVSTKKVSAEQAHYDSLQGTMTDLAVNRFVGHNTSGLSPLFSSAAMFSAAQQYDALTSVAFDNGAATADDVESAVRQLQTDRAQLVQQQQQATDLMASLTAKKDAGEQLIAEYTQRAADAKAKYGELVQQEADRQASLAAEKAAAAAASAAAADAPTPTSPPVTAAAPRGGGGSIRVATGGAASSAAGSVSTQPPASAAPAPSSSSGGAPAPRPTPTPAPAPTPPAPSPPTPSPPPPSGRAGRAVAAAYSVLGTPYVAFQQTPQRGFDCSGLTTWAWAQAGVSIPHQSAMQYATNPHVPKNQAQPGDLIFYYSPISHVGIYVGGGKMIDSPHTGAVVRVTNVRWNEVVGVARPG